MDAHTRSSSSCRTLCVILYRTVYYHNSSSALTFLKQLRQCHQCHRERGQSHPFCAVCCRRGHGIQWRFAVYALPHLSRALPRLSLRRLSQRVFHSDSSWQQEDLVGVEPREHFIVLYRVLELLGERVPRFHLFQRSGASLERDRLQGQQPAPEHSQHWKRHRRPCTQRVRPLPESAVGGTG